MVPYKDIDVEITGLRPGERLSERLAELPLELSAHPQILKARQKAPSKEQLIALIGYVLALTDMAHPRLGELIVSVANDAGQEVDISELNVADLRVLRPAGRV
jgi:FlaA1/EpsC-like NDP-sugar epimerase